MIDSRDVAFVHNTGFRDPSRFRVIFSSRWLPMNLRCPKCRTAFELQYDDSAEIVCPSCQSEIHLNELLSLDESLTQTSDHQSTILEAGDTVAHFRIRSILGRGGFGTVYAAFDERLQRIVALKLPRLNRMSQFHVDLFFREAQAAAQLRHPNIVGVHEVGRDGDRVYIVSDYVEGGQTLVEWSEEHKPTAVHAARMIADIARAMHMAHEKGVVHRDLKPRNILVDGDGKPHITDFGMAKRDNPENFTISAKGRVMGTPAYMSPEQAAGKAELADRRTDVYSLGVVLYELLAGRRPFVGESGLIIDEVIEGQAPPVRQFAPQTPKDLEAICLKAIETNPGNRFATGLEFADELERFIRGEPTLTRPLTRFQRGVRTIKRHLVTTTVGSMLLLLAGIAFYLYSTRPAGPPDVRKLVEFKVIPPRADVAIVKVDFELGRIDYDNVLFPDSSDDGYWIKLEPGWYIIEASMPGFGVQEVWRNVPEGNGDFRMIDLANYNWELDDNRVTWKEIEIHKNDLKGPRASLGEEAMVRVQGGEFTSQSDGLSGFDGRPRRPAKLVQVPDFYMGKYEVSFENFHQVMQRRSYVMNANFEAEIPGKAPMTNVSFYEALEYCERIGGRLPVFDEYLYAATNGGQTKFPWGDEKQGMDGWQSREIGKPEFDLTLRKPEVHNLFSSVLEWTQDVDILISKRTGAAIKQPFFSEYKDSRIVVGGPPECIKAALPSSVSYIGPGFFLDVQPTSVDCRGLGFRVVKSITPRLGAGQTFDKKTANAD